MRGILEYFFTQQTPLPGSSEGLPYWIFWFLLCIILLLLIFIFLRDKDLRRRISLFLFGAKKKLVKLRLQTRLKRECRKKDEFIKNRNQVLWQFGDQLFCVSDSSAKTAGQSPRVQLLKLQLPGMWFQVFDNLKLAV